METKQIEKELQENIEKVISRYHIKIMATYELINDEETTKLANERVGKLLEESSKEIMGLFESRLIEAKRETLEKLNDKVYKEAGGRASFAEHDGAVPVANIEAEFMGAFDDVLEDELSKLSQSK